MSSARMPPRPSRARKCSQDRPRSWYGRSVPWNVARRRHRREPLGRLPGEQVAERPVGVHLDQRQVLLAAVDDLLQHLAGGQLALAAPADRLQRRLELPVVQLHPLPADPHQRHLQPGQLGQLLGADRAVADDQVDPEVDELLAGRTRSRRRPCRTAVLLRVRVVSFRPTALRPAQAGSCTPNPAACSRGAAWRRKSCASPGVERHRRRLGVQQRLVQRREQPDGAAEPGQQRLVGSARQPGHPGAGPQVARPAGRGWGRRPTAARTPAPSRRCPAPARSAGS